MLLLSHGTLKHFRADKTLFWDSAVFGKRIQKTGVMCAFCRRIKNLRIVSRFDVDDLQVLCQNVNL